MAAQHEIHQPGQRVGHDKVPSMRVPFDKRSGNGAEFPGAQLPASILNSRSRNIRMLPIVASKRNAGSV
jgi:hypothetical protein